MASLLGNSFYTASSMSIVSGSLWKEGKYLFFHIQLFRSETVFWINLFDHNT